ncbi:hypothetical protein AVEN_109455-1 [Araneus ventricosus]|uniref:Uncharacterized protein n=1 Tax=Araneus ventricosus TaxID=182803 RepID=A0A4Y2MGX7_ARAVE|nr:hypothetical protein AVEN_109455-1 [Araneus ventricosus]
MMLRHPIPEVHSPVLSAVTCLTAKASGEEGPEPRNTLFLIARACRNFYLEWPKGVIPVFRRPDLRSQRPKSIFSPPRKSSPCSFLSSSKNSLPLHPRSSLFNPHLLPTGGAVKSLSTNPRQFCRWSLFQRAIIGSLPFWSFPLSQAASQAGDKCPNPSLPLTSSPSVTGWTPGSLCRRFNEDSPLRHLLCSVTHDMGKKLLVVNDLGGSFTAIFLQQREDAPTLNPLH